ncbi:hypothetical protein BVX98_06030 [bacterium F11]|nr:hypothetical protein BVX98_06030 [bacterium F11]
MASLRNRILFFFTLFAGVAIFAVFLSSRSTRIVGQTADRVVNNHLPMVYTLGQMEVSLVKQDAAVYRYISTGGKQWLDVFEKERINYVRWFLDAQENAEVQSEKDKLVNIDEFYIQYENQVRQILLNKNRSSKVIKAHLAEGDQYLGQIQTFIDQIESLREGMTLVRQDQINQTLSRHKRFAYYFLLTIGLFFFLLATYLWHYLVRPLTMLLDGIRNFTRGRLDIQIPPIGKDELGELQDAFNEMSREIAIERKRLKTESQSDPLTGLFNMRYFRTQLADEFSRSKRYAHPLSLLMIDVDHFKMYNDQNGHPAGDIVLKEISRILIRNVRGTDIVARYGGEEFVILLPETILDAALKVATKIRSAVEAHHFPFQENQEFGKLTVSIGIASYPDDHVTSDHDLVEASDKALYLAKQDGRNQTRLYAEVKDSMPPANPANKKEGQLAKH